MTDLLNPPTLLDQRATRLLRLGLSTASLLRAVGPEQARKALVGLDRGELLDMVTLLAACVDIDRTTSELTAWWTEDQMSGRSAAKLGTLRQFGPGLADVPGDELADDAGAVTGADEPAERQPQLVLDADGAGCGVRVGCGHVRRVARVCTDPQPHD